MAEFVIEETIVIEEPDVSHLITEDDEPVDNIFSAKQQRLLVRPLYTAWQPERPFVADANVGIFASVHRPAIVPDMFLSLDVEIAEDWYAKEHRSYFLWEFGKPPEVVVEVVSNKKGNEMGTKLRDYARIGVLYYVVYDPQQLILDGDSLRVYELRVGEYVLKPDAYLDKIGLSLTLWDGVYEMKEAQWLRWCDGEGVVLPTGAELADQERQRANEEHQRAEHLAAQLRALGIEPEA